MHVVTNRLEKTLVYEPGSQLSREISPKPAVSQSSSILFLARYHVTGWRIIHGLFQRCKLIKAFPKDIAALDKSNVLAKVNSQGSGT